MREVQDGGRDTGEPNGERGTMATQASVCRHAISEVCRSDVRDRALLLGLALGGWKVAKCTVRGAPYGFKEYTSLQLCGGQIMQMPFTQVYSGVEGRSCRCLWIGCDIHIGWDAEHR